MRDAANPVLLLTKTSLPSARPDAVRRERVTAYIERRSPFRLLSVCAPAGYGKTTAVNQWALASPVRAVWLALDELDNDMIRFWRYMMAAAAPALPETMVDAFINELHDAGEPLRLLLDDYHCINNTDIHDSVVYFLEYAPEGVCVVLTSRQQLPFPTAKWEADAQAVHVDAAMLTFDASETARFYESLPALTNDQLHMLHDKTAGWAAGMRMIDLSLKHADNIDSRIVDFSGYQLRMFDYLLEEVLSGADERMRQFLLRTSVLRRMDAELCGALAGGTDSAFMLRRLHDEQLFVQPLDEQHKWYKYHPLFAECLRNELRRAYPQELCGIHREASACLARRGMLDEALHHAFEAKDYTQALALLERYVLELVKQGELSTLLSWIGAFPGQFELPADMLLIQSFVLAISGRNGEANALLRHVEDELLVRTDGQQRRRMQSGLLFVRSNLLFSSGQLEEWFAFADGMLDEMLPREPIFYNFNYNTTYPLARMTAMGLGGALSAQMERIGEQFVGVLDKHGWSDSLINVYVVQTMAEGRIEWNLLPEAQQLIDRVARAVAGFNQPVPGLYVPNRIAQALVYEAQDQLQLAAATLDEALAIAASFNGRHWYEGLLCYKVRLQLAEGELAKARQAWRPVGDTLHAAPTYGKLTHYLTLARLLGAQSKWTDGLRVLERLAPQARREQSYMSMAEIAIMQSVLSEQAGYREQALRYVGEAVALGEPFGYIRSFVSEGETMRRLLQRYAQRQGQLEGVQDGESQSAGDTGAGDRSEGDQGQGGYIARLLGSFPDGRRRAVAAPPAAAPPHGEALTPQELKLLEMVKSGAANRQIAARLALSEGTVKVYLSRMYSKLGVSSRTQAIAVAGELKLFGDE